MAQATTEKDGGAELEILNAKTESGTEETVDGVTQEPDQLSLVSRIRKTIVKYIKLLDNDLRRRVSDNCIHIPLQPFGS